MKNAKVWMRMGDNDDYNSFDSPYDAGIQLGSILNCNGQVTESPTLKYRSLGVEAEGFCGDNYISLFWGNDDAQPVNESELNQSEKLDFEQGLLEGINS